MSQDTIHIKFIYIVSSIAAIGGLLFGYDTAVIAGAIGSIEVKFNLSPVLTGWAASSAIWGCILGAMSAGYVSDKFGRKKILIVTALLFALSAIGSAIPQNLNQFVIARFVGGVGVGAASMLSPMYISEIAPADKRGMLVTLYQLAIVIGINLIYFVNLLIAGSGSDQWNIDYGWRYMLGSEVFPAMLFLFTLFCVPESPRWLASKGKNAEAMDVLKKVNGNAGASTVMAEIKETLKEEKGTISELFAPGLRTAMVIGMFLALFSQITGINAIIYYAPEIFKSVGFGTDSALTQTVIIGLINTLFTFVALKFIDRTGRRKLLLWGISGMVICLFGVGIVFHFQLSSGPLLLIFILGFIASFASSLGPIPWVLISEIFPTKTRGTAMSFAILSLWIGVVLVTQLTPVLLKGVGGAITFWIFGANTILLLIFTLKMIPETKGKTLEEIEKYWKKNY
ncbi:sugar porter family MFS transporter [Fulvivirga sp. M361]|uniref:sugar porter family MFS transporter n=1 Tax=Fulvivirga sp. M361 TaxID=2594266 RepID=UPI00117B662E|nr:sugar porter family MFS transporter [Fulvivirga sp. M361]TRX59599.1 sugar porter family MFS transporter [Fulvivirga sp. M361]